MKKIMILIAAMAMATLTVQANSIETIKSIDTVIAAIDSVTEGDTNGTKEEAPKGN